MKNMKKVLFLIHDLGQGGAEKVLVNLVNHMDYSKFNITVIALFGGGVNEQFLAPEIRYITVFPRMIPGNTKWMKLLSPAQWHRMIVREHYDIEISYLEGPSARVVSGCKDKDTKLISWIHVEQKTINKASKWFRNQKEAKCCYNRFDQTICVSKQVKADFCEIMNFQKPCEVLYNTVESEKIKKLSCEAVQKLENCTEIKLVAVGSLKKSKGYDRLLNIVAKLKQEGYKFHLFILGIGPIEKELHNIVFEKKLSDKVTFLGYQTNPYKFVAKCDLLVCASHAEGFSTAVTEALILGVPVCTVDVSGMKEILGENNEFGVVTENNEVSLYKGIKMLLDDFNLRIHYKNVAEQRGQIFSTAKTVKNVEKKLLEI